MIDAEHETPRPSTGEGFADVVGFVFGDPETGLFGSARLGLTPAASTASALALLFSGGEAVASVAEGGQPLPPQAWTRAEVAGVRAETIEPLANWRIALDAGGDGFDLRFAALSAPGELGCDGYGQLCRVAGTARVGGRERPVDCLGQRSHEWGVTDWDRTELQRSVSTWLEGDVGLALRTTRAADLNGHEDEQVSAFLLEGGAPAALEEARLSTVYDAEGRQRRAGAELWVALDEEEAFPRRAAGEAVCGTTLELGRLRLDCAFFDWRMEGRTGAGCYDVLRRA